MTLPFKATHREDLPVKFKGCDRLQELLQMLILFPVQFLQPLHNGLLIHSHMLTSKRKSSKKKSAAAGIACGREGGKGEPKSGPFGALKRKSPPPFPPRSGCGNDGKPYRVYHITTASAHPPFPLRLSPCPRENFRNFFEGLKALYTAYIINRVFPYFSASQIPAYFHLFLAPLYGIYYQ